MALDQEEILMKINAQYVANNILYEINNNWGN